jgi:hypothetical protein
MATGLGRLAAASASEKPEMPVVFEADFEDGGLDAWRATDAEAWRVEDVDGNKVLSLFGKSRYRPKVRSPRNMILVEDVEVGSFSRSRRRAPAASCGETRGTGSVWSGTRRRAPSRCSSTTWTSR